MNDARKGPLYSILERVVPRLKYPQLFAVLTALFLIDLFVPDPIPFVDEVLLGVLTLLVGSWTTRRGSDPPPPKDVTDRGVEIKDND
jgi:hypothetical protein